MAKEPSEQTTYYYLAATTNDVIAEIGVNGAPIIKDIEGEGVIASEPVSTWLFHGNNKLTIKIHPLNLNTKNEAQPSVSVQLFEHDSKFSVPTPKVILAKFEYPSKNSTKDTELPLNIVVDFEFKKDIGTNLWKEAEEITEISDTDKNEILSALNSLTDSLVSKNVTEAIKLQKYKITDDSIAEKKPVEQLESAAAKGYSWLNEQSGVKAIKISEDSANFTLCCNNKVIYVTRNNGDEAILLESDDLFFDIAAYFSKINGKWIIVR